MDDREVDAVGDLRPLLLIAADRLVRAPLRSRNDRRRVLRERLHMLRRTAEERTSDKECAQPLYSPTEAVLDPLGAPDPERVAEVPAPAASPLRGPAVRQIIRLRRREVPAAPGPVGALRSEADAPRPLPVQPHEIEGVGRLRDPASRGEVSGNEAWRSHRDTRRGEEEDKCSAKQLHARATRFESGRGP